MVTLSIICVVLAFLVVALGSALVMLRSSWKYFDKYVKTIKDYDKMMETISSIILLIPTLLTAKNKIDAMEIFFEDTIEDVDSVIEMLDKLNSRKVISDDPDVKDFCRVIAITHDTLVGYRDAKKKKKEG